jgi:hypothetical protein
MVNQRNYRRWIISLSLLAVFLIALWWAYTHAIIQITTTGAAAGNIDYRLSTLGKTPKDSSFASEGSKTSRIIGSGEYSLTLSQDNKNYFSVIKAGHWLSHTKVAASLKPEKQRVYVGDKPLNCMFFTNVLYSLDCGNPFSSIVRHVPADSTLPTYIETPKVQGIEGVVEGMTKTNEGNLILVHPGDVEGPGGHIIYQVDASLNPTKKVNLKGLDSNIDYSIANFRQGFLIYSTDLSQVFYYGTVSSTPQKMPVTRPSDKSLKPISLMVNQEHISTAYSQTPSDLSGNQSVKNEVIDFNSGVSKKLDFRGPPLTKAVWCAADRVCVLSGKLMLIYSMASGQQVFSLGSMQDIAMIGDKLLLADDKKILQLDAHNLSGVVDYSYGGYSFCGLQGVDTSRYMLCLQSDNKKVAIMINRDADDKDSLDKKIQQLSKLQEVSTVSVYGHFIHISPDLGALVYNPAQSGYTPDPAKQKMSQAKINAEIDKLGIDKSVYIINIAK